MANNVDLGGVATKTLEHGNFHVQYYILLGSDAPSVSAVNASATVVNLVLAMVAPMVRRRLIVHNAADKFMYIKYGTGASLALYSYAIAPGNHWEMPDPPDSGIITAIWEAGVNTALKAMVTELTSTGAL